MKKLIVIVFVTILLILTITVSIAISSNGGDATPAIQTGDSATTEPPQNAETYTQLTIKEMSVTTSEPVQLPYTTEDIEMLAKLIWGEARGVKSDTEKAAVVWCVLNRVDAPCYPDTIAGVVTQPRQFVGYKPEYPVTDSLRAIAEDVLYRWYREQQGDKVLRVLPKEYFFFTGDGKRNYFRQDWEGGDAWDWRLESPYKS